MAAFVLAASALAGATPAAVAGGEDRPLKLRAIEYKFQGVPEAMRAGLHPLTLFNNGVERHHLLVAQLAAGHEDATADEIMAVLDGGRAALAASGLTTGGFKGDLFAAPEQEGESVLDLSAPGRFFFFCPVLSPDRTRHFRLGMFGFIETVPPLGD